MILFPAVLNQNIPMNEAMSSNAHRASSPLEAPPALPEPLVKKWDGWGTSLCWWAHVVGSYPEPLRSDIAHRIIRDLNLNIVRYNIGGGENPAHTHIQYRANMPGFQTPDGKYHWDADAGQRWMLKEAIKLGANRVEAFSNSAPYWMTLSGCSAGGPKGADNMDPNHVNDFATYLVTVAKEIQKRDHVKFVSLEPLNEPGTGYWQEMGRQEGMDVTAGPHQSAIVEAVARELKKQKVNIPLVGCDETGTGVTFKHWPMLSETARNAITRINSHAYSANDEPELRELAAKEKKGLWMSEYGDNDASGMTMARRIITDILDLRPTAWVYWQAIDQSVSGWGCLEIDLNHKGTEIIENEKYSVMKQFTHFIPEGSTIYQGENPHELVARFKGGWSTVQYFPAAAQIPWTATPFGLNAAPTEVRITGGSHRFEAMNPPSSFSSGTIYVPANSVLSIRYRARS